MTTETIVNPSVVVDPLAEIRAELARLKAENESLKASKSTEGLGIKVSEKGAISVYGLGRFPVTLYREQWVKLFAKRDDIEAFAKANETKLSVKPTAQKAL
jgi:hypothetical protein